MHSKKEQNEPLHKVIILGAGATRGASIFENKGIKPPVDNDFFSILEKLSCKRSTLKNWLKKLRACMGIPLNTESMESVFTKLETLANFLPQIKANKGPVIKRHTDLLDKYSTQIAYCFNEIVKQLKNDNTICSYHKAIVESLSTKDCIISFNYDCLIDIVLKSCGNKKWDASSGYGYQISENVKDWHEHDGKKGKNAKKSIQLLKLHGSLNWKIQDKEIELRAFHNRYETNDRNNLEIIPPVWNKNITKREHFNEIWTKARIALQKANTLVIIGYSLPDTDLLSQALLQVDTAKGAKNKILKTLIIVNPDFNVRKKIIRILNNSINSTTSILEYRTIKEYSETLQ